MPTNWWAFFIHGKPPDMPIIKIKKYVFYSGSKKRTFAALKNVEHCQQIRQK